MSRVSSSLAGPVAEPVVENDPSEAPSQPPPSAPPKTSAPIPIQLLERTPSPSPHDAVDGALSRSLGDWIISPEDVDQVHATLDGLPPAQFRALLDRMARSGTLERYLTESSPPQFSRFIQQALDKGIFVRVEGTPSSDPRANPAGQLFDPPAIPAHLRPTPDLPGVVIGAMVRQNNQTIREYDRAYRDYVDRYAHWISQANQPDVLRELGEVVKPHPFCEVEPYKGVRHPPSFNKAEYAWARQAALLRGDKVAGFQLERSQELTLTNGKGVPVGAGVKVRTTQTLDALGRVTQDHSVKLAGSLDAKRVGLSYTTNLRGELQSVGVKFKLAGYEAEASIDATAKLALSAMVGSVGAKVVADPAQQTLGAGITKKVGLGPASFSHTEMIQLRGLQADAGERFIHGRRELAPPEELRAGITWEQLPPARQHSLSATWSPAEWNRLAATKGGK